MDFLIQIIHTLNQPLKMKIDKNKKNQWVDKIKETREGGGNIFIIGNGGSDSTASHWACDLAKGTIKNCGDKNEKR